MQNITEELLQSVCQVTIKRNTMSQTQRGGFIIGKFSNWNTPAIRPPSLVGVEVFVRSPWNGWEDARGQNWQYFIVARALAEEIVPGPVKDSCMDSNRALLLGHELFMALELAQNGCSKEGEYVFLLQHIKSLVLNTEFCSLPESWWAPISKLFVAKHEGAHIKWNMEVGGDC